jgi:alpha-N-arabinofuranosidase
MNSQAMDKELGPENTWVQFNAFSYASTDAGAARLPGRRQFLNPILAGFYPDPSICRVGEDYYLVNSSFSYFPGVPIFHSKDLVSWTQLGCVLDRPSQFSTLGQGDVSRGIYAPSIRCHHGIYYLVTTLINGGGNFYVTAHDPAGPWSEPNWLPEVEGIDPSFFFDDDGGAYVLHCAPPANNRALYSGHRTIRIQEFDLTAGRTKGRQKILIDGGTDISKQPIWIEGPHLFKREGRYYLIAAEGGTGEAHSEVVFRADSVWGPFIPFAGNPILTQRHLPDTRPMPITCAGHADFTQTPSGEWWAVFLACRPYERNCYNTGRETFLLPVRWENDWPIILKGQEIVPRIAQRPDLPLEPAAKMALAEAKPSANGPLSWTDYFDRDRLDVRWHFLRPPAGKWYSLRHAPGSLLIAPRAVALSSYGNPSFIGCRQQHANFAASVEITVNPQTAQCEAGLVAFQNETHYLLLGIRVDGGRAKEVFLEQFSSSADRADAASAPRVLAAAPLPPDADRIALKIESTGLPYCFYYGINRGEFKPLIENVDGSILSTRVAGGFQGVMLAMFARRIALPPQRKALPPQTPQ